MDRLDRGGFDPGKGLCTYRLTGQKLSLAAAKASLPAPNHTALADARTSAALVEFHAPPSALRRLVEAAWTPEVTGGTAVTVRHPWSPPRRGSLHQAAAQTPWPGTPTAGTAFYLDTLGRCLDDGFLDLSEQTWLDRTAEVLGLSHQDRTQLHNQYYELLKKQILADGIVTEGERRLAEKIAAALSLGPAHLRATRTTADRVTLQPGMAVCFTGTAIVNGTPANRELLEKIATQAGMRPLQSVTKRCDLLVAADPLSQSGKSRTARARGIPIINTEDFLNQVCLLDAECSS